MFKFLGLNSKDIGIDLGTANILVTVKEKESYLMNLL